MAHALTDHPLPGLDEGRLAALASAGVLTLEDVVDAGTGRLATLTGFDTKTAGAVLRTALATLAGHDPTAARFAPPADEPSSARLARGLGAARRIERVVSTVHKARSHASAPTRKGKPKERWPRRHKRARAQLRGLLDALEALQQSVLSDGLSQIAHDHLEVELRTFEGALQPLLDLPVRKRTLKRLARLAKATRRALTADAPAHDPGRAAET